MSNYFTKNNTVEVGPGPDKEIEWLVIEEQSDFSSPTRCVSVYAEYGYQALNRAERAFEDLQKNKCKLYPNPKLILLCKE